MLVKIINMKLRLLQQCMMGTWNLNHNGRLLIVLISQIGGKLCVLSFLTWNISKFGKSLRNQAYQLDAGKDFQENHTPVISDMALLLLMVIKTIFKLESGQFDIETAFLYGKLDEDLWMAIPDGYDKYLKEKHKKNTDTTTHCLKLTKVIYGLVQAARQWWKKFKEVLAIFHYIPSRVDPCLFIRMEDKRGSYLIIYVDDGGVFYKSKEEIKQLLKFLSQHFVVKDLGEMEAFVGCKIISNK
jgi:Reverse transcriptase (RNA-dependent DNA polymerase)